MKADSTPKMIQEALRPLLGLPLSLTRRSVDLRVFHFGDIRAVEKGSVGKYALHISGKWVLEEEDGILVRDTDLYSPLVQDHDIEPEEWDYDTYGNWQDELLKVVFSEYDEKTRGYLRTTDPLIVENIHVDIINNVRIVFSHGYTLSLIQGTSAYEDWRLFEPESVSPHFVVLGTGIEGD